MLGDEDHAVEEQRVESVVEDLSVVGAHVADPRAQKGLFVFDC